MAIIVLIGTTRVNYRRYVGLRLLRFSCKIIPVRRHRRPGRSGFLSEKRYREKRGGRCCTLLLKPKDIS